MGLDTSTGQIFFVALIAGLIVPALLGGFSVPVVALGAVMLLTGLAYVMQVLERETYNRRISLPVIGGWFLAATLLMLYPATRTLDRVPIGEGGDAWFFIWEFWWVKKSLLGPEKLFFTDYLYHPTGTKLYLNTFSFFNSGIALLLQLLTDNLVLIYNSLVLLSFVLTGVGTYLLVSYLTGDRKLGFLAGVVFTFAPFRMARALGHLNLLSTQFLPFFVLFLIKTVQERGRRNPLLAAGFFVLLTASSYFYGLFGAMFAALLLGFLLYRDRFRGERNFDLETWKRIAVMGAASFLVLAPLILPIVQGAESTTGAPTLSTSSVQDYLRPNVRNALYGTYTGLALQSPKIKVASFLGYTVVLLSGAALFTRFRRKWFWFGSAAFFGLLSTGTLDTSWIPVLGLMQRPDRYSGMVMFSLLVPFSYGVRRLASRFPESKRAAVYMALAALVLLEFAWLPYPATPIVTDRSTLQFYEEMRSAPEGAVLDIPLDHDHFHRHSMYLQTVHHHKIVGGRPSRPLSPRPSISSSGFLESIRAGEYSRLLEDLDGFETALESNFVRYIILHRAYPPAEWSYNRTLLNGFDEQFNRTFGNGDVIAYRVY